MWTTGHVYGRAKSAAQLIPGWPYSFVAALEPGRTSWTAILDAVRVGPADDTTALTAAQLRDVVQNLITAGQHGPGDLDILIVCAAGYDVTRLAFVWPISPCSCWDGSDPTGYCDCPSRHGCQAPTAGHPMSIPPKRGGLR